MMLQKYSYIDTSGLKGYYLVGYIYHGKIKLTTIAPASFNKISDFQKAKNGLTEDIDTI